MGKLFSREVYPIKRRSTSMGFPDLKKYVDPTSVNNVRGLWPFCTTNAADISTRFLPIILKRDMTSSLNVVPSSCLLLDG